MEARSRENRKSVYFSKNTTRRTGECLVHLAAIVKPVDDVSFLHIIDVRTFVQIHLSLFNISRDRGSNGWSAHI